MVNHTCYVTRNAPRFPLGVTLNKKKPVKCPRVDMYYVQDLLPEDWQSKLEELFAAAVPKDMSPSLTLARESSARQLGRVDGLTVVELWPELDALYRGAFRDIVEEVAKVKVFPADDRRYGVVINVQDGPGQSIICHVDSQPWTALLFFTDHGTGSAGELRLGLRPKATSRTEVDERCFRMVPRPCYMTVFSAMDKPHYTLEVPQGVVRATAAMNYYTLVNPERDRSIKLNEEHFGRA